MLRGPFCTAKATRATENGEETQRTFFPRVCSNMESVLIICYFGGTEDDLKLTHICIFTSGTYLGISLVTVCVELGISIRNAKKDT